MAYGQTSAGKTHILVGSPADPGIIPRFCEALFALRAEYPSNAFEVRCSYFEIYNEVIYYLLEEGNRQSAGLSLREDPIRGVCVEGLSQHVVLSSNTTATATRLSPPNRFILRSVLCSISSTSLAASGCTAGTPTG